MQRQRGELGLAAFAGDATSLPGLCYPLWVRASFSGPV